VKPEGDFAFDACKLAYKCSECKIPADAKQREGCVFEQFPIQITGCKADGNLL
jgi:hypothetical protein